MRVIYALLNYPQVSESYIEAEIAYATNHGVQIEVWSPLAGIGVPAVPVHRGTLQQAIGDFRPDLIHIHYLITAQQVLGSIPARLPVTVRAHSFDWEPSRAASVAGVSNVRAVYAFPHFAREVPGGKVAPLPVAFDANLYDSPNLHPVSKGRVIRLAAGRPVKGLEDFLQVARKSSRCLGGEFHMAVSCVHGDRGYVDSLVLAGAADMVPVYKNIDRTEAVRMIRTAGIYLETSDPTGHRFGMPVSVAEAMASGLVIIMRDSPAGREYGGEAASYYSTIEEATILVDHALRADSSERERMSNLSIERSKLFRSDVVLPRLIGDWRKFA